MTSSREETGLKILFEDNHVIAVIKPGRVPIQRDESKDPCLFEHVCAYLKEKYQKPGNVFLGMVHRLDRPVSGVVLFAKTSKAAGRLSDAFRTRNVRKVYHALVQGELSGERTLQHYHRKQDEGNLAVIEDTPSSDAKEAVLHYRVKKSRNALSLLEVELKTGRRHQIRAQLAHIGHPIVGDRRYGSTKEFREGEIALKAMRLEFPHPVKEEWVKLEVDDNGFEFN